MRMSVNEGREARVCARIILMSRSNNKMLVLNHIIQKNVLCFVFCRVDFETSIKPNLEAKMDLSALFWKDSFPAPKHGIMHNVYKQEKCIVSTKQIFHICYIFRKTVWGSWFYRHTRMLLWKGFRLHTKPYLLWARIHQQPHPSMR